MNVIGIDPGTKCGWASRMDGGWDSGVWNLQPRRHEGGGMRYLRLRKYFSEMLNIVAPEAVFYEEVRRHMGVDAAHVYGGIVAIITEECDSQEIPYLGIPVGTIKKVATGKGNASKEAMIEAARQRWPGWDGDDNEADARWVAVAGMEEVS